MDIGFAVDGEALIVREFLDPWFAAEAVNRPVIPVKQALAYKIDLIPAVILSNAQHPKVHSV